MNPPVYRRFKFSLRGLLVVVLVLCCGLGWLTNKRRQIADRRGLLEAAGFLSDDHGLRRRPQPAWDESLFGNDWPRFAVSIYASQPERVTDEILEQLADLTELKVLTIKQASKITDAGLVHLRGLRSLVMLLFEDCRISDAGLVHLKNLQELKILSLNQCPRVTDTGLQHLHGLRKLESIELIGTGVSEGCAREIRATLPNCEVFR